MKLNAFRIFIYLFLVIFSLLPASWSWVGAVNASAQDESTETSTEIIVNTETPSPLPSSTSTSTASPTLEPPTATHTSDFSAPTATETTAFAETPSETSTLLLTSTETETATSTPTVEVWGFGAIDSSLSENAANPSAGSSGVVSLKRFKTWNINGGYVSAGVGMRNKGYGTITLSGIPTGATVKEAYLYWNILSSSNASVNARGYINGKKVSGKLIGTSGSPCWGPPSFRSRTYRATVTGIVKSNGVFSLTGFASGLTNGASPQSTDPGPMLEGASLVVIYTAPGYPKTQIFLYDGAALALPYSSNSASTTIGSFNGYSSYWAYTTFIAADGQPFPEVIKINNQTMSAVSFEGGAGQFWDNDANSSSNLLNRSISIGNMLPANTKKITVSIDHSGQSGLLDCVVHVAQVLSVSNADKDSDGDGLKDGWEFYGYDYGSNGTIDVNLPALGATPLHKDLFLEIDWMSSSGDNHHRPNDTVVNAIVNTFAQGPVKNPDGLPGVRLVIDRSNAITHSQTLASNCADLFTQLETIKSANMVAARYAIYHYQLWVHDLCPGSGSSGIAQDIPGANSIVSLGSWGSEQGTTAQRIGTALHELGHNLNLRHGFPTGSSTSGDGKQDDQYTPNHLSVMSYLYQTSGLYRNGVSEYWDYQRWNLPALNEKCLREKKGVGTPSALDAFGLRWYRWNGSTLITMDDLTAGAANGPVDWNGDGIISSACVKVSINRDADLETLRATKNEWALLVFNGGAVGFGAELALSPLGEEIPVFRVDPTTFEELTYEEFLSMEAEP